MLGNSIMKSTVAVAVLTLAFGASIFGMSDAHAASSSSGWQKEATYGHYLQCQHYGQLGEDSGQWGDFYCEPDIGSGDPYGTKGPVNITLWVKS